MRILDRYVLASFLKNYFISFFVLVGMYVVLDMVFNFDDFVAAGDAQSAWQTILSIGDFYFYQAFLIFVHLSGIIPVVAAAFTLMRFSRNNEVSALLAAGVPLLRVAAPIIIVSVLLNALVLVDTEMVIPQMIPKLNRKHEDVRASYNINRPFPLRMFDDQHNLITAGKYIPRTKSEPAQMENITVILRNAQFQPIGRLTAESSLWDSRSKSWHLIHGSIAKNPTPGQHRSAADAFEYAGLTPDEITTYHARSAKGFNIRAMEDQDKDLLCAARYLPAWGDAPPTMEYVDIIFRDPETLMPTSHLAADQAYWDDAHNRWILVNGVLARGLLPDQPHPPEERKSAYQSNITPDEIGLYRSREFVEFLPTSRINQILAGHNNYGVYDLLRVKHFRFTQPLVNVILLLMAIPCVLLREPGQLKIAATKCLVLIGMCMGVVFLAQQMAGNPPTGPMATNWSALMAWMPIFMFAPLSLMMMERVKT